MLFRAHASYYNNSNNNNRCNMYAGPVRFKRVPWLWSPPGQPWENIGPGGGYCCVMFPVQFLTAARLLPACARRHCHRHRCCPCQFIRSFRVVRFAARRCRCRSSLPLQLVVAAAARRFLRANFKSFFRFSSFGRLVHDKNTFVFEFFFLLVFFFFRSGHVVCDQ